MRRTWLTWPTCGRSPAGPRPPARPTWPTKRTWPTCLTTRRRRCQRPRPRTCRTALQSLWEEAGGSSGTAFMAAEIATAESGGNPNAVSPTDDFGLWQINGSHGSMATLDPLGNAHAAISISDDGHDWGAWTTFTSGAYAGRC